MNVYWIYLKFIHIKKLSIILLFYRKFTPLTTPPSTVLPIPAINKETEITIPIEKHSESKTQQLIILIIQFTYKNLLFT